MLDFTETQKYGAAAAALGGGLIILGMLLFFDAGLIAIGNIFLVCGLVAFNGFAKTGQFFAQRRRIPGTICFTLGVIIVFFKWPIIGLIVELFGFINLFGDFFPYALGFLRRLPGIGTILNLPYIRNLVDRAVGTPLPV
ncbi:hypothetical protein THASP1DRAFT_27029 [Thamnocephalis sphaerospora]|uniref:Vesicle transport protein n=1 Tax=Thamnocephalis sphaerospora TaxID=78915 RepID=A0A4P9XYK3_9FUNG|nr:hypothetical protein THASP1DRAFT_27029 [Thamnocephalis sphaerospora]|eukprot:RKP11192.1 hypothetical protein THASP1DRAFT_27029 [Thamnocephalis sphaerospora]